MTTIAVNCIEDLAERVRKVPLVEGRVFQVYSEGEIDSRTRGVSYPCVGVAYLGIRSIAESKPSGKMGVSAELVASIMVFFRENTLAIDDPRDEVIATLDSIRGEIMRSRSPTQHYWRFQSEVPMETKKGILVYVQRWTTPVQL